MGVNCCIIRHRQQQAALRIWSIITSRYELGEIFPFALSLSKGERKNFGLPRQADHASTRPLVLGAARTARRSKIVVSGSIAEGDIKSCFYSPHSNPLQQERESSCFVTHCIYNAEKLCR